MSMKMVLMAAMFVATSVASASETDADLAYETGRFNEALAVLEERGLEGDVQAQELVGMMYLSGAVLLGHDIKADPVRAAKWLRAAAVNGSANSQFVLAMMYLTGVGVPGDAARAEALVAAAVVRSASTATTVARHSDSGGAH
jgi:TPR repeat protein